MIIYRGYCKNKSYIGCTSRSINTRISEHKCFALTKKYNLKFHKAIRKYGINNFKFEILEIINKQNCYKREKYWIKKFDSFNNGYNDSLGGKGANGHKHKKITIKKIITTKENKYAKEFMFFNKNTNKFYGIWKDKLKASNYAKIDHSYLCKILNGHRTSPSIYAKYMEVDLVRK